MAPPEGAKHGTAHHHSDFYSQENPIPSIQNVLKKGANALVARRGRRDSEDEFDSEEESEESIAGTDAEEDKAAQQAETEEESTRRQEHEKPPPKHHLQEDEHYGPQAAGSQNGIQRLGSILNGSKRRRAGPEARKKPEDERPEEEKSPEERSRDQGKGNVARRRRGKAVRVFDPITQQTISVRDVRKKDYDRAMKREEARRRGKSSSERERDPAKNVTNAAFPPLSNLPPLHRVHPLLIPLWVAWCAASFAIFRSIAVVPFALANAWLGWWAFRHITLDVEQRRCDRELSRGRSSRYGDLDASDQYDDFHIVDQTKPGTKEGAEWLNTILQAGWEAIDPAIFETIAGTLEDVMQASAPSFIHMIKVSEVAHGLTPFRIGGVRLLPDFEDEEMGGKSEESNDSQTSKYINIELSLLYHASQTGVQIASRRKNARLVMQFYLGLRKFASFPLPIWVEIKGFVGTVRLRLQLTPEAPFIKNLTMTFVGLPRVQVEVIPLRVNLANIPILSGFVQSSIDAAMSEYVAPSSLTLDVGEILLGDNIKREVNALGVIVVWIHSAFELEAQDSTGSSDPYVTVSFARLGKVTYATRVALNDLNPRWEERHVMLLNPEAIRAKERLSLALWDSDRLSQDDILGRVELDLAPLIRRPGQVFRRTDTLMGLSNEHKKQGQLNWSVAFFRKVSNKVEPKSQEKQDYKGVSAEASAQQQKQAAQSRPNEKQDLSSTGPDSSCEDPLQSIGEDTTPRALLEMLDAAESAKQTRNQQTSVQYQAPDPQFPSGILSIQVHNIEELGYRDADTKKVGKLAKASSRAGAAAQDVDDKEDESEDVDAPSPYSSIILNDVTAMISRVKALTNTPFFNIGTERFIRDWRRSCIMVVVRDRRLREVDPILGVVPVQLKDLFTEHGTSQVTAHFPLAGGIGYGRVRMSVLFRPIEGMHLDKSKLGFDVGTMRIRSSPRAIDIVESSLELRLCSLRMRTLVGQVKMSSRSARRLDHGKNGVEWRKDSSVPFLRVPARRRYAAPLVFEFRRPNTLGVKSLFATSIIWLQDVQDDHIFEARLPIYRGKPDLHRLLQNYHDYRHEEEALELGVEKIGTLEVSLQFKNGIGQSHAEMDTNPDSRMVLEAWQACVSAGLRNKYGDFEGEDTDGNAVQSTQWDGGKESSDGESEDQEEGAQDRRNEEVDGVEAYRSASDGDSIEGRGGGDEGFPKEGKSSSTTGDAGGDGSREGLSEKFDKWRAETKELHRQHRGIKSHKAVRSADWILRGAKQGGERVKRGLKVQERGATNIESELG
ncbi:unnamed protein product [Jaminaea pallidilutea]